MTLFCCVMAVFPSWEQDLLKVLLRILSLGGWVLMDFWERKEKKRKQELGYMCFCCHFIIF